MTNELYKSIKAQLMNDFQNEDYSWYDKATKRVMIEVQKTGNTIANIINKLYR